MLPCTSRSSCILTTAVMKSTMIWSSARCRRQLLACDQDRSRRSATLTRTAQIVSLFSSPRSPLVLPKDRSASEVWPVYCIKLKLTVGS